MKRPYATRRPGCQIGVRPARGVPRHSRVISDMSDERNLPHDPERDRWEALARRLAGDDDASGSDDVDRALRTDAADEALVAALEARADAVQAGAPVDVEGALSRVKARIAAEAQGATVRSIEETRSRSRPGVASPARSRWGSRALAAAAVLAAVAGMAWWRTSRAPAPMVALDNATRVFVTDVGVRDSLQLPDGTRIIFAPRTRVELPGGYGARERVVRLVSGTAYFHVAHDDRRPFRVLAPGAEIRDIGTAFTVRAGDASPVTVVVTEGIVAVRAAAAASDDGSVAAGAASEPEVELRAGDRGTIGSDGVVDVARGVATDDDVAWMRGTLSFRETPMVEVQAALLEWYGIRLSVDDATLAGRTLTATFGPADDAATALRVIALAIGAEVEQRGDSAILRSARGSRPGPGR